MNKKNSVGKVLWLELVVFILVFVFNVICTQGASGVERILNFVDLPSLILILLLVIPTLVISGMGRDFLNAFSIGKKEYAMRNLKRSLEAVQLVQKLVVCSSGISSIIAIVTILSQLDDLSTIGPNLAVAILVIFYAVILELFLIPLKANVQNAITDLMNVEDEVEDEKA